MCILERVSSYELKRTPRVSGALFVQCATRGTFLVHQLPPLRNRQHRTIFSFDALIEI
jgi:hypothetical protein